MLPSRRDPRLTQWLLPCALMGAFLCLTSARASATCPPEESSPPRAVITEANKARALVLFKAGNNLLERKDYEGALDLFLQSRTLWLRPSNTKNAAICLLELRRYPEALAMYEEVLAQFEADLDAAERVAIEAKTRELKQKIAIVSVQGEARSISIDDASCGSSPRSRPMYVLPGTHIVRASRRNGAEWFTQISTQAGSTNTVRIPPERLWTWFVDMTAAPVWGLSGMSFDDQVPIESLSGFFSQVRGGYRFANGLSFALASGVLYFERSYVDAPIEVKFGKRNPLEPGVKYLATYQIGHAISTVAPFMGGIIGIEPNLRDEIRLGVRLGVGILAAQSKDTLDVNLGWPQGQPTNDVLVEGRNNTLYSAPLYSTIDISFSGKVGRARVGLTVSSLFMFVHSAPFSDGRVAPRGSCSFENDEGRNLACVPAILLPKAYAYRPAFFFIPQIFVGLEP